MLSFFAEDNERSVTRKRPIGPGANIVTKHDAIVCGRKNTKNIENVCALVVFVNLV